LHHEDKENFQSLLEELKTSFADSALILTTEVSARPEIRNVAFDMNRLLNSVDFINLVSWDLYGPWQPETGFGNSLNGTYKGSLSLVVTFDTIPNNEISLVLIGSFLKKAYFSKLVIRSLLVSN
jgi:GH18 family chitinase